MHKLKFLLFLHFIFVGSSSYSQLSSFIREDSAKSIIDLVAQEGYTIENCTPDDSVCHSINNFTKKSFDHLKDKNVGVIKIYNGFYLNKKIEFYGSTDTFDRYFKIDTESASYYFFKQEEKNYNVFGAAYPTKDKKFIFYPVSYSEEKEVNYFLSYPGKSNSILLYPAYLGYTFLLKDNSLYIIDNGSVKKLSQFAREKYSLKTLNLLLSGTKKGW